eukprot:TRINITY_DN36625_c0_g1_i1.p1 TRINITY_DN36625_c0_g1~~TRINITY_DN36625_c0_g1_i1.p1  ORF type:complete len:424 (+),score=105.94 TRINITY_DN36625_c0_g1_i1:45-1316(+)
MGDRGGQDAQLCLICHDNVLSQPTSALLCGHVYHSHCIQLWISQSRSECPQCKKKTPSGSLRRLDLETIEVLPDSLDMVRRLLADSEQQRAATVRSLAAERKSDRAQIRQLRMEAQNCEKEALGFKRHRRELEQALPERQEELAKIKVDVNAARVKCAEMQTHLDHEHARHFRSLPIAEVRQEDSDCLDERKKLRHQTPAERARALHEAATSAREQDLESHRLSQQRIAAADEAERELRKLRQQEHALKRELETLREHAASAAENAAVLPRSQSSSERLPPTPRSQPSSEMLSQDDGSVSLDRIKQEVLLGASAASPVDLPPKAASPPSRPGNVVAGTPQERKKRSAAADKEQQAKARAAAAAQREAEDEDDLFGGPARQALKARPGASLLGSKPGLLGKASRASPATAHIVSSVVTPSRQMR